MSSVPLSRRTLFGYAAAGAAAAGLAAVAPPARAQALGTLVDYSAGVPKAAAIRAAGHVGVVRYVSERRPGAEFMLGKPLRAAEVVDLKATGLSIVSNYQFGKGDTSDWLGGLEGGKQHAERGLRLHREAGGPDNAPIYVSIDSNPSREQFDQLIAPYLEGWRQVAGRERVGAYANAPTIDWIEAAGGCPFYWQHNWGTPKGVVHPAAHLHQVQIETGDIDGIQVDLNQILKPAYGQW